MSGRLVGQKPFVARAKIGSNKKRTKEPSEKDSLPNWRSLMSAAILAHGVYKRFHSQAMGFARKRAGGALTPKGLRRLQTELAAKMNDADRRVVEVLREKGIVLRGTREEKQARMFDALAEHSPGLLKELHACFAIQHGLEKLRAKMK